MEPPIAAAVEAARSGDPHAWDTLVDAFQDMAVGLSLGRLGDFDAARDAAQDAFATAFERIDQLRDPAAFPGWFAAIVRTGCSRRLRMTTAVPVPLDALERASAPEAEQPSHLVCVQGDVDRVRAAVEALPEHERTVIALHYLAELTYPEISQFLGINESATRKRSHAARRRLKENLTMTTQHMAASRPSRSARFRDEIALFAAIRRGDHATLRALLANDRTLASATESWSWEEGFDAALPAANDATPLIRAVQAGDLEAVEILLAAGADVNGRCQCEGGETPLWTAVLTGHVQLVERLLSAGAEVDMPAFAGATPLHVAAQRAPGLMQRLIAAGADPSATDARGQTATDWMAPVHHQSHHHDRAGDPRALVPSGIRALDLFAPIRRGDRQYWPPAVKLGQTVLLYELARALEPDSFWWIGFECGPYDRANLEHHSRELGVDGTYRLAPQGLSAADRRHAFSEARAELNATVGDSVVVLLAAPGFQHEITLGLQALSTDRSVLLAAVVEPQIETPLAPGHRPPEGYDSQIVLDVLRARRRLYPAIDSALTVSRDYPDERHAQLAERARALLDRYLRLDPKLDLPDPATLPDPTATAAQQLLGYLRQPFTTAEPFHSFRGQSTPYPEMLDRVAQILAAASC